MLLEIFSTVVMGGVLAYSYLHKTGATNDPAKIQRIAKNCGLTVKEKNGDKIEIRTMQLMRRKQIKNGMEYVYRIPLGKSFKDFEEKLPNFQDGLNNKVNSISIEDITKWLKTGEKPTSPHQKKVEMSYDGMLHIKVLKQEELKQVEYKETELKGWNVPVGEVSHDFEKLPHIIVAGFTGFGKSNFLKMLIVHLLDKPVRFYLVDLKGGLAFSRFKNLKQVEGFARNTSEAKELLETIQTDMDNKIAELESKGYEDVAEANDPIRTFVIIDEAADLDKDCKELVADLARRGRGSGYRLVYSTQYPTNETLPSQVRANISARICFRLPTSTQSLAVLDEGGAEKLPEIEGRAIYKRVSSQVVQIPFIRNEYIKEKIQPHIRSVKREPRRTTRTNPIEFEEIGLFD